MTESAGPASARPVTPWATTALKKRAPSTWSGTPRSWAIAATVAVYSTLSGWAIEWAWVFSIVTRPVIGSWGSLGSRNASTISAGSSVPSGHSRRARIDVPTITAWPAASSMIMWLSDAAIVSWPRARWPSWATRLPWVPDETNKPASLPSRSAARSSRAITVGSSPKTSSPTSALAIARRIASVGRVTVSERRSIRRIAAESTASPRPGARDRRSAIGEVWPVARLPATLAIGEVGPVAKTRLKQRLWACGAPDLLPTGWRPAAPRMDRRPRRLAKPDSTLNSNISPLQIALWQ